MQIPLAALLMVLLDIPMEMVAYQFDYWHFSAGMPPMENYISWFFIGLIMQTMIKGFELEKQSAFSLNLYFANLAFFLLFAFQ